MSEPRLLVFDLETQKTADEVGGWDHIRDMRLAVGVTYNPVDDIYRDYTEAQAQELIAELRAVDLIVGYNLLRFDYQVLRAYTTDSLRNLPTADMMVDLYGRLGWRPRLDDLAAATLGERKSADGLAAVRWFRNGEVQKVIDYCRKDVEITWRVYDFGRRYRYVKVFDRSRRPREVPVSW